MMIKTAVAFVVCLGISWWPNLNETPKRYKVITDSATLEKIERCGDFEELKVNEDLQHHCKGVTYDTTTKSDR